MRILSLTYEYPPVGGGGGVVAAALNRTLAANGHALDVVTSRMPGLAERENIDGVTVHRSWCRRRHRHYTTALELTTTLATTYRAAAKLIEQQPPDLIHTHFVVPSGIVARALSARYRIPFVLTAHGSDIPGYNPDRFKVLHALLTPWWRRVMQGAAAITSPSQFLADLIHESIDTRIKVIPNGYTPDIVSEPPRPKRKLVLVVARMFPRKGVQHFIDSIATLPGDPAREWATEWDFVVAGDGPYLPALRERATNVGARVRFVGFIDKHSLRSLYEEASILVFPSIRENFPMVLLEAMDAGCAVITTDAEGCAEVVGDAGVVFEKGNSAQLRESLIALMNDPARCAALSRRALERSSQYRWSRVAVHYQELFESVARRSSVRSALAVNSPAPS